MALYGNFPFDFINPNVVALAFQLFPWASVDSTREYVPEVDQYFVRIEVSAQTNNAVTERMQEITTHPEKVLMFAWDDPTIPVPTNSGAFISEMGGGLTAEYTPTSQAAILPAILWDMTDCWGQGYHVFGRLRQPIDFPPSVMLYHEFGHAFHYLSTGSFGMEGQLIAVNDENVYRALKGLRLRSSTNFDGDCGPGERTIPPWIEGAIDVVLPAFSEYIDKRYERLKPSTDKTEVLTYFTSTLKKNMDSVYTIGGQSDLSKSVVNQYLDSLKSFYTAATHVMNHDNHSDLAIEEHFQTLYEISKEDEQITILESLIINTERPKDTEDSELTYESLNAPYKLLIGLIEELQEGGSDQQYPPRFVAEVNAWNAAFERAILTFDADAKPPSESLSTGILKIE